MFYASVLALPPASATGGFVSAERQEAGRRTGHPQATYLKKFSTFPDIPQYLSARKRTAGRMGVW